MVNTLLIAFFPEEQQVRIYRTGTPTALVLSAEEARSLYERLRLHFDPPMAEKAIYNLHQEDKARLDATAL